MRQISTIVLLLQLYSVLSAVPCPNKCSGHGACSGLGATCECFPGYHGPDCSSMLCPSAKAWFDAPYASNRAHADFTECSNMGHCNRKTGECVCRPGFTGAACDIMQCPNGTSSSGKVLPCSGNGRCMSLRDVANYQDFEQFFNRTSYSDWDADMVHGCDCDDGWEGAACNLRSCPKGDDPYTAGDEEVQIIDCTCTGGGCDDNMQLSFKGKKTLPFRMDATEEVIKHRLESVHVNIFGETFCSLGGSVTRIIFKLPQGDVPAIELTASSAAQYTATIFTDGDASVLNPALSSVAGTTEYVECSNHGQCDHVTGACACFKGYGSSDGFGNAGRRGDCGYQYLANVTWNVTNVTSVTTMCPYVYVEANETRFFCSGHGSCNVMTGKCTCDAGYEGGGCERRTCGTANAWFGDIKNKHTGLMPCAGVGDCNHVTGKCTNCGGGWGTFYGDQCQFLSCATTLDSAGAVVDTCSGNGVCLSLREMALLTYNNEKELAGYVYDEPWDADMVRGCACYRSWTVDNKFITQVFPPGHISQTQSTINFNSTRFYRGPYAFAVSDFIGYDCSHGKCPTGINPELPNTGVNEVQFMVCQADEGSFTLTFRENTTEPILNNATALELEAALEKLYTIHDVTVTLNQGATVCDMDGSNITIEFVYEFGDLPLITANTDNLIDSGNPGNAGALLLNITEQTKGTKIDVECSAQGICDTSRGVCDCLEGYMSSGGDITSQGERGDCSYYNSYYTIKKKN